MAYAWGCHGVEVEVDRRTGQIDIVRYIAAHDVGKAINPLLLRGQILGGGLQGIGWALAEEMIFDAGKLLNPNFRDYKMLTALDSVDVEPILIEDPAASGPYGAKGIGEPGLVPTAPVIANAIYDGGDQAQEAADEAGDGATGDRGGGGAVGGVEGASTRSRSGRVRDTQQLHRGAEVFGVTSLESRNGT